MRARKAAKMKKFQPEKLKALRGQKPAHLVAAEIEQRLGEKIHPDTLLNYENPEYGRKLRALNIVAALAAYHGVKVDELFA